VTGARFTEAMTASQTIRVLRLVARTDPAPDVAVFHLAAFDGGPLPAWQPGAHVDLMLPGGQNRQYSLCGDPADRDIWRIGVLREPDSRGGSEFLHRWGRPGLRLLARDPGNHFRFEPATDRVLFIAGGIGVTPLVPMLRRAADLGLAYHLVYGARSRSTLAFADELLSLHGDHVTLWPEDEKGLLPLGELMEEHGQTASVYCCGPAGLLDAVEARFGAHPDRLHVERFAPRDIGPVVNRPLQVMLARSGLTLDVRADRTILDTVTRAGVDVLSSCEDGICGTCETRVLEGTPEHRDSVLDRTQRASGATMMICCSRAASDSLVLDL